jgi:hypothetical protein
MNTNSNCYLGSPGIGTDSLLCNAPAFGQFATVIGNVDAGFMLGTR